MVTYCIYITFLCFSSVCVCACVHVCVCVRDSRGLGCMDDGVCQQARKQPQLVVCVCLCVCVNRLA